ncbi:MAG: hypothetical protein FD170_2385 [Bacteroidetes bacterium]|nr:MAG: hypothetical protein FD170_2385 [Bacteroidota bacterium]
MKFLAILIFFQIILLGCTGKVGHNNKISNDVLHLKQLEKDTIRFTFNFQENIKDYKIIDFKSSNHNFDNFTNQITELEYDSICKISKNKLDYTYPLKDKDFFISTEYGLILFNSIEDGDLYNEYKYIGYVKTIDKHIIFLQTIDLPITIFISNNSYNYFYVIGEVYLPEDENYFISTYVDVDYSIVGFYKITTNGISNVINLYSDSIFINKLCIKSKIVLETILMNNNKLYYELEKPAF